jgi:hypothetical protein
MHVMSHTMPVSRSLRRGRLGPYLRVQHSPLHRKQLLYSRSAARCFNAVPWPGPAYANIPFRDNCAARDSGSAPASGLAMGML